MYEMYNMYIKIHISPIQEQKQKKYHYDDETSDIIIIPSADVLKAMTLMEIHNFYHSYVNSRQTLCRREVRIGQMKDGGWEVCEDAQYRPERPCLVYSFGYEFLTDFSFDDGIEKRYGCEVHSFDPTIEKPAHRRGNNVWFHPIGLGGVSREHKRGPMMTLGDLRETLNHTNREIDIIKIDIEGMEWSSIPEMLSGNALADVRQLIIEFHSHRLHMEEDKKAKDNYIKFL
ncbi:hypothetical protein ScPMuIL_008795 [Solemya velum]